MLPDIQPGNTKILYFFNCLLDGMHTIRSQQKYHVFICFDVFSAYYNNNSNVSPLKNNSTESRILLEPIQIPPAINRISLPSQSTAPEESLFACGKFLFILLNFPRVSSSLLLVLLLHLVHYKHTVQHLHV